jgi:hypothetical protein
MLHKINDQIYIGNFVQKFICINMCLLQCVLKEGTLNRTKITENGKKLRKNWAPAHVVLTELFLLFFKDAKTFETMVCVARLFHILYCVITYPPVSLYFILTDPLADVLFCGQWNRRGLWNSCLLPSNFYNLILWPGPSSEEEKGFDETESWKFSYKLYNMLVTVIVDLCGVNYLPFKFI